MRIAVFVEKLRKSIFVQTFLKQKQKHSKLDFQKFQIVTD